MTGPLEGIRVLDLGTLTPGKYCSYILAELGADVIRVERPGSHARIIDDEDLILNQGKRSVQLNLRSPTGLELFFKLVEDADIIIEGNRPGTADRNGFGYEAVKARNRSIIYLALSAYGATGPMSQSVGYDLIFLGLSGLLRSLTGQDKVPSAPSAYLADGVTGLSAVCKILLALFTRQRTGQGQFLDLGMFESAFSLLAVSHGIRRKDAVEPVEPAASPVYDVYAAAQNTCLVISAIRASSNAALFAHLGRSDLASHQDPREVRDFLTQVFRTKSADQWVAELAPLDVEIAKVNSPHEAYSIAQLRQRGMVGEATHPDKGDYAFIHSAIGSTETGSRGVLRCAPQPGEHTNDILMSIGLGKDEIAALQDEGIV